MTRLPCVTGDEVVKALTKKGFFIHHQKGSHVTMKNKSNPSFRVVIPLHKGKTLGKGLILSIIKDAGLTVEEFNLLL